jgi:BirA family biotin operon repressor/biotin-[acetyl-CoA-carboxylase] ligase
MNYDKKDNKLIILDILKNSSTRVSGEELSRITSISRVGVWKHINSLKEHGYEINSNRSGYLLESSRDLLQKWEFPRFKDSIKFYPEIDSTMKKAKSLALSGAKDRTIVAAEKQTQGRDRKGRIWESKGGGLYFTIILRPQLPLNFYNLITLATAVGINNYLKSLNIDSSCKWPNDILIGDEKISGILTEISGTPERIEYALVGIGMNINNSSSGISLKDVMKKEVPRNIALNDLLINIFSIYDSGFNNIPELWSFGSLFKGTELKYKINKTVFTGKCKSITRDGNLILETDKGTEEIIFPGDERVV